MFSSIRYAAHVLSHSPKPDPYTQPDIIFKEEEDQEVSKISRFISNSIGFFAVAVVFGASSAFIIKKLPVVKSQNVTVAVGIFAIILSQVWHHFAQVIQNRIQGALRIGERIGPYFGRKITKAVRILRS